jgi:hypothetical protein
MKINSKRDLKTKFKLNKNQSKSYTNQYQLAVMDELRCFDSHYMKCVTDFYYLNAVGPHVGMTETC